MAFDGFDEGSLGDFRSKLLNEIILSLPKLKSPVREYLSAISLKSAAEGKKESLWTNTQRFPKLAEFALVSALSPLPFIHTLLPHVSR